MRPPLGPQLPPSGIAVTVPVRFTFGEPKVTTAGLGVTVIVVGAATALTPVAEAELRYRPSAAGVDAEGVHSYRRDVRMRRS